MTTYRIPTLKITRDDQGLFDEVIPTVAVVVVLDGSGFSYTEVESAPDRLSEVLVTNNAVSITVGGEDLPAVGFDLIGVYDWGRSNETTVYINVGTAGGGDADYFFVLDGTPVPFTTGAELSDFFINNLNGAGPVRSGPFQPDREIPFDLIQGVRVTERDVVYGDDLDNTFNLGLADDFATGGGGDDVLIGGQGADDLNGNSGDDRLEGQFGDDDLSGGGGNDTLIGGFGYDNMSGDWGNDEMFGGAGDDNLEGGDGNDLLVGADGDDFLFGDAGNDRLFGGSGDDELFGGDGFDNLSGGDGADRLVGQDQADTLYGDAGDDRLVGNRGNDKLFGGDGDDFMLGQTGGDQMDGGTGSDVLYGGKGNDTLIGGGGFDWLDGGGGADTLDGGRRSDTLNGGGGRDTLTGGASRDTFVFEIEMLEDRITDFEDDVDTLLLDERIWGGGLTVEQVVDTFGSVTADGFLLALNDRDSVLLEGVTDGTILYDDISFA